mmetsp:Transcript_22255/g.57163  ORF Transcript_22255/g.57163 Transcript_22255/m.57163 type:complete len:204 (+) Transcript_22255:330-941(+)
MVPPSRTHRRRRVHGTAPTQWCLRRMPHTATATATSALASRGRSASGECYPPSLSPSRSPVPPSPPPPPRHHGFWVRYHPRARRAMRRAGAELTTRAHRSGSCRILTPSRAEGAQSSRSATRVARRQRWIPSCTSRMAPPSIASGRAQRNALTCQAHLRSRTLLTRAFSARGQHTRRCVRPSTRRTGRCSPLAEMRTGARRSA